MEVITSRKNSIIRHGVSLITSPTKRREENLFVTEGARLCEDAAKSGIGIFRLLYTEDAARKYKDYIDCIKAVCEEEYLVEPHVAELLSTTKNSQGIFCVCRVKRTQGEIKGKILVLENIQEPGNLGGIFRTGEALGIDTFILVGNCCDIYSQKVLRASMGGVFRLNTIHEQTGADAAKRLKALGFSCLAAVVEGTADSVVKVNFKGRCALFIGNEGSGLTQDTVSACDQRVTIPMDGRAESLNAGTAAAIIMWEMVRPDSNS